jgi:hypothetical protein
MSSFYTRIEAEARALLAPLEAGGDAWITFVQEAIQKRIEAALHTATQGDWEAALDATPLEAIDGTSEYYSGTPLAAWRNAMQAMVDRVQVTVTPNPDGTLSARVKLASGLTCAARAQRYRASRR